MNRQDMWSAEETEKLLSWHDGGKTFKEIGRMLERKADACRKQCAKMGGLHHKPSICWDCACATYGTALRVGKSLCEWGEKFEPVPGWTADPAILVCLDKGNKLIHTYNVRACPRYVPDPPRVAS